MSGIAGVWRRNKAADHDSIHSMLQTLSHRGPDGQDIWLEENTGLGACLLHTTPESIHEKAVTEDASGRFLLVWDGRIDNRAELLTQLSSLSSENTDPDFILAAYRAWGTEAFPKILGDFSFALWDRKEKSLLCVRDRIGLKPFHYMWEGGTFAFASEAKALFGLKGSVKADEEMLLAFLSFRNFKNKHQHHSFYAGIRRLPPAHYLSLKNGQIKVERYWNFDLSRQIRFNTMEEYASAFREIFTEAVRCRTRANAPVAASLSGGLDSSAIVSVAGKTNRELHALNFYCEDPNTDERSYASEVAEKAGVPIHMLFCKTNDFETGLNEFLAQVEAPMINTSRNLEPYQFMKDRGWRVVLSGEGGDQVMDEFGFAADLLARFQFSDFLKKSRLFAADFNDRPIDFMKESFMMLLPQAWQWFVRRIRQNVPPSWINRATAQQTGLFELLSQPEAKPDFQSFTQQANYEEVVRAYAVMKLELEERAHAQFGLEPRFPFLDSRVIEFILAMPREMRSSGVRKEIVRLALKGIVPASVLNRHDKATHTAETDRAIKMFCQRPQPEALRNVSGSMEHYVDFKQVKKLIARYLAGQKDLRFEIWFLITADHWLSNLKRGDLHVREEISEEKIQHA